MLPLIARFPALSGLPHHAIGTFPTPVEEAPALAQVCKADAVFVKRDDQTGPRYGGNKVRKLEFLLGVARASGAERVWTAGAIGSNHCLATTVYARELGLSVQLRHFAQEPTPHVRENCLAVAGLGAELTLGSKWTLPVALRRAQRRARGSAGPRTIAIPAGGSNAVGILGYVNAALEIDEQIRNGTLPAVDRVVVPVGTAGTLAGLAVGFRLAQRPLEVVGVRVIDRIVANRWLLSRLISKTAAFLGRHGVAVPKGGGIRAILDHSEFGDGYGKTTPACDLAVDFAKDQLGLGLEHTYTGKALAWIMNNSQVGHRVLYIDTLNSRSVEALIPPGFGPTDLPAGYRRFFE